MSLRDVLKSIQVTARTGEEQVGIIIALLFTIQLTDDHMFSQIYIFWGHNQPTFIVARHHNPPGVTEAIPWSDVTIVCCGHRSKLFQIIELEGV